MTQVIADKEKKSSSYKEGKLESLSDEKVTKIKKFAKEYIAKVLHKIQKSNKKRKPSSSAPPTHAASSASAETPNSPGDPDLADGPIVEMTVEEAMDLEDSDSDADMDERAGDESMNVDPSPTYPKDDAMEVWANTTDPRARHRGVSGDGWDRDRGPNHEVSVGS